MNWTESESGLLIPAGAIDPSGMDLLEERKAVVIKKIKTATDKLDLIEEQLKTGGLWKAVSEIQDEVNYWRKDIQIWEAELNQLTMAIVNTGLVEQQIETGKKSVWVTLVTGLVTAAVVLVAVWLGSILGSEDAKTNDKQPAEQASPIISDTED